MANTHPKTMLITGTRRGIGSALAANCQAHGWRVIRCQRDAPFEIDQEQSITVPMDVRDPDSVQSAVEQLADVVSHLDVLVNNAGVFPEPTDTAFEALDPSWFKQAMEVNLLGTVHVTQAFLPWLRKSPQPRMVNLSSGAASITRRSGRRYCYGASKAALNHMTRGLAHELEDQGVCVVALSPGWVRTDMGGQEADLETEPVAEDIRKTIESLDIKQSGTFLDRHGQEGTYSW